MIEQISEDSAGFHGGDPCGSIPNRSNNIHTETATFVDLHPFACIVCDTTRDVENFLRNLSSRQGEHTFWCEATI